MRTTAQVVSLLALVVTAVPPFLYFAGVMELGSVKLAMSVATVVWFAATPLWMGREKAAG